MSPQKQLQRLRFVHLGWLGMVLAVALSVLVSREKEALSFAWLGLAALPGLTGYALLGRDRLLNQFAPSFLVITWTVFAAFALALSGAAMSPLAVLFVIAPLVGFDPNCYRLGYGGGFFDRTLEGMNNRPLIIGVGSKCAAIPTIFPQPHDIPMDVIITGKDNVIERGSKVSF